MPEGGVFTNQIQTDWMCYNFVLWCMSKSKVPLACVWNEGVQFYTAGRVPEWCEWFI